MALPEDHDDPDEDDVGPLLPPEDRLWRHPTELRSHPLPSPTLTTAPPRVDARPRRRAGLAAVACLAGLVMVTGALWITWPRQSPEPAGDADTLIGGPRTSDDHRPMTATASSVALFDLLPPASPTAAPGPARMGVQVVDFTPAVSGLLPTWGAAEVVEVSIASPAADVGLQPGDLIVAVDDVPIGSAADLVEAVGDHQPGDEVDVRVARPGDGHSIEADTVTVRLGV